MILNKNAKRLGLFIFYDKDNQVDDYVQYLLKDITENLDHLTIISNSPLDKKNYALLSKYSKDIIERENIGLDAGALSQYFQTRKEYLEYDEVVCLNDTFFGPFYPFKEIFTAMNQRDVDFWGLSLGNIQYDGYGIMKDGYIKEHLQTFFYAFRKTVTTSEVFQKYWEEYDISKMATFYDVVTKHELQFTNYLKEHGFSYESFIKEENVSEDYHQNYNTYFYNSSSLIKENHAPYLKKKLFSGNKNDLLYLTDYQDLKSSLDYIENNTSYDMTLIWKNILRIYNLSDIKTSVGFERIVEKKRNVQEIFYLIYIDDTWVVKEFEKRLDSKLKYQLYTSKKEVQEQLEQHGYKVTKIKEFEWKKTVIKTIKTIEDPYICYLYFPYYKERITMVSEAVAKNYFDNIFSCSQSIMELFQKNSHLSIAYAPNNLHYDYFSKNISWNDKIYQKIKELLPNYAPLDQEKLPVSSSEAWITSTEYLKEIAFSTWEEETNDEFSILLTIYLAYYATFQAKYPIITMEKAYAEHRLEALNYINTKTYQSIQKNQGILSSFPENLVKLSSPQSNPLWKRGIKRLKRYIKRIFHKKA